MLTSDEIERMAQQMDIPVAFIGFKDELPKKLEYNKTYIINQEDHINNEGEANAGSHWTGFQVNHYHNGKVEGIYFDSYGSGYSKIIKSLIKSNFGIVIPHTTKDIQSLMNNACGWYVLAFFHFINGQYKSGNLYNDTETFLSMFNDLNEKIDFKQNEYILKHFFQPKDPALRKAIDVISDPEAIDGEGISSIPCEIKYK
tara:strand:+ start:622 stop:1221 length:600 start_codon:yes stop_codon:yes gene_type:complete